MTPTPKLCTKGQIWGHNSFNWAAVVQDLSSTGEQNPASVPQSNRTELSHISEASQCFEPHSSFSHSCTVGACWMGGLELLWAVWGE